jgi:hypothetical protein
LLGGFCFFLNNRQLRAVFFHYKLFFRARLSYNTFNPHLFLFFGNLWVLLSVRIELVVTLRRNYMKSLLCLSYSRAEFRCWEYIIITFFLSLLHEGAHSFNKALVAVILHHLFHGLIISYRIESVVKVLFLQFFFEF